MKKLFILLVILICLPVVYGEEREPILIINLVNESGEDYEGTMSSMASNDTGQTFDVDLKRHTIYIYGLTGGKADIRLMKETDKGYIYLAEALTFTVKDEHLLLNGMTIDSKEIDLILSEEYEANKAAEAAEKQVRKEAGYFKIEINDWDPNTTYYTTDARMTIEENYILVQPNKEGTYQFWVGTRSNDGLGLSEAITFDYRDDQAYHKNSTTLYSKDALTIQPGYPVFKQVDSTGKTYLDINSATLVNKSTQEKIMMVKMKDDGSFWLSGLPSGSYYFYFNTYENDEFRARSIDFTLSNNQVVGGFITDISEEAQFKLHPYYEMNHYALYDKYVRLVLKDANGNRIDISDSEKAPFLFSGLSDGTYTLTVHSPLASANDYDKENEDGTKSITIKDGKVQGDYDIFVTYDQSEVSKTFVSISGTTSLDTQGLLVMDKNNNLQLAKPIKSGSSVYSFELDHLKDGLYTIKGVANRDGKWLDTQWLNIEKKEDHLYLADTDELFEQRYLLLNDDLKDHVEGLNQDIIHLDLESKDALRIVPLHDVAYFNDLEGRSISDRTIANRMFEKGIIEGNSNHNFNPDSPIKREEMIIMLVKMIKAKEAALSANMPSDFEDVTSGHWAEPFISYALKHNITSGQSNNTFGMGQSVSDIQAITFIVKDAISKDLLDIENYKDPSDDYWSDAFVRAAYSCKAISFISQDDYTSLLESNGGTFLTRLEIASLIDTYLMQIEQ